ncbi:MAG: hypothetical protein Q7W30_09185 [Coriobacteriia bacterium]|nr:hypothetical protein [Coriobacteriia bacterium]
MSGDGRPERRRLLPDLSIVIALFVALAVSGTAVFWLEYRLSSIEARLDRELRVSNAVRALPATPATLTPAPAAAGIGASAGADTAPRGALVRFVSMEGSGTALEVRIVYVQRVSGKAAAAVAASYGDVPTDGAYIIDTGERTATMTVALRAPVKVTANPVPSTRPPADASALASALTGTNGAVWRRCYFEIDRDGTYITSIRQAHAPLRTH